MSTAEPQAFRWYCITGRMETAAEDASGACAQVVCFVQASSRRSVVKYYGGRRHCTDVMGRRCTAVFPTRPGEVIPMPADWSPEDIRSGVVQGLQVVVQVIPAIRYKCDHCGAERMSERWYAHVWCGCGHAARPVNGMAGRHRSGLYLLRFPHSEGSPNTEQM